MYGHQQHNKKLLKSRGNRIPPCKEHRLILKDIPSLSNLDFYIINISISTIRLNLVINEVSNKGNLLIPYDTCLVYNVWLHDYIKSITYTKQAVTRF